jgi:hypothetical protein
MDKVKKPAATGRNCPLYHLVRKIRLGMRYADRHSNRDHFNIYPSVQNGWSKGGRMVGGDFHRFRFHFQGLPDLLGVEHTPSLPVSLKRATARINSLLQGL